MTDTEKKIAEIREWHEGKRDSFPQFTVFEAFGVMLDELDREREESRKLREDIERIVEILKNGQQAHWQTFKIRQLLGVTVE